MAYANPKDFFSGGKVKVVGNEADDIGNDNKSADGKNFFQRTWGGVKGIAGDVKETGVNIGKTFKEGSANLGESIDAYSRGKQSLGETVAQGLGQGAKAASGSIGEIVMGAGKVVLPQDAEDAIKRKVTEIVQDPAIADKITSVYSYIDKLKKENPRAARNIEAALGFAELATDVSGAGVGKKFGTQAAETAAKTGIKTGQAVTRTTQRGLENASDILASTANKVAPMGKQLGETALSQASGFNPETIRLILNDPKAFKAARESGLDRLTIATDLKGSLAKRVDDLGELGKEYDPIRTSNSTVKLPTNFFEDALNDATGKIGLQIDGNKIIPTTTSVTRNSGDINAVQKIYDTWDPRIKSGEPLTAQEYLNLRSDLADLAKYDKLGISGKTNASETIAKEIRRQINTDPIRKQIPGLKELDEKFAPEIDEIKKITKELFDKNGDLKDSAMSAALKDSTKGNRTLTKLKELDPKIEGKLKMINAIKDVEYASGQKVGTYFRAGSSLAVGAVNPIAGVITFFLTQPEAMIKYLSFIGNRKGAIKGTLDTIASKIRSGTKLVPKEKEVMESVFKTTTKKTLNTFLETMGTAAGASAVPITKEVAEMSQPTF